MTIQITIKQNLNRTKWFASFSCLVVTRHFIYVTRKYTDISTCVHADINKIIDTIIKKEYKLGLKTFKNVKEVEIAKNYGNKMA